MFSRRTISPPELARTALVFTAIADSWTTMLLRARVTDGASPGIWVVHLNPRAMIEMAIISAALYGFGLSLNDLIDRRRDQQLEAHRPFASGKIGVQLGASALHGAHGHGAGGGSDVLADDQRFNELYADSMDGCADHLL